MNKYLEKIAALEKTAYAENTEKEITIKGGLGALVGGTAGYLVGRKFAKPLARHAEITTARTLRKKLGLIPQVKALRVHHQNYKKKMDFYGPFAKPSEAYPKQEQLYHRAKARLQDTQRKITIGKNHARTNRVMESKVTGTILGSTLGGMTGIMVSDVDPAKLENVI